jgi:hypothetical protein
VDCDRGDQRLWKLLKMRVLEPFCKQEKGIPPFESIFKSCGYDRAKQAMDAFDTVKDQLRRKLRNVVDARFARTGIPGDEMFKEFEAVLERECEYFYRQKHTRNADGEGADEAAIRGMLRRYVERKQYDVAGLISGSDPMVSGEVAPDLSRYSLYAIALAFLDAPPPQPTDELARAWNDSRS